MKKELYKRGYEDTYDDDFKYSSRERSPRLSPTNEIIVEPKFSSLSLRERSKLKKE